MKKDDDAAVKIKRRDMLKIGTAAAAGFVARGVAGETVRSMPNLPSNPRTQDAMPTLTY